jgi:ElaB/YqjD/DUF883 family membrane-anchored ribosome-binding protein
MTNEHMPFAPTIARSDDRPGATPALLRADEAAPATPSGAADTRSSELLGKVVRSAHQSLDRLAESAAPSLDHLEQSVTGAAEALQARGEHWRETGDAWAEDVRRTVREHPLAALGIAVAVGMLLSRLSAR